ncbi:hypothetical protein EVAR_76089_1 [Eumeta japonica]|uniref:Sushi domain-containing protein n=1 Tax=Eumeta variegata TaxID=151549 RepID=A0A4C1W6J4_EUMVA|nr:hypothetical protein EVAR_76089_1 [Eumeta japonica]
MAAVSRAIHSGRVSCVVLYHSLFTFATDSACVGSFNVSRYNLGSLAQELSCEPPPFPKNGAYALTTAPEGTSFIHPGRIYIRVVCDPEYSYVGAIGVYCQDGVWSNKIARCINDAPSQEVRWKRYICYSYIFPLSRWYAALECALVNATLRSVCMSPLFHPLDILFLHKRPANHWWFAKFCYHNFSFGIKLYVKNENAESGFSEYKQTAEDGDTVYPRCEPPYYLREDLPPVHCRGRTWSYKPKCTAGMTQAV